MSLLLLNTPRLLITSSFLLKIFPVPPFLSSIYRTLYHALSIMHLHACVLPVPSLASNVLCRLALGLEIETLAETILRAQRKERFVLRVGARLRGDHVACATEM
jgi:hypothetical protein